MRIAFYTLGCKVNQYDTQMMRDLLECNGHTSVSFNDEADCYIINTCTVTNMSDRKSRQIISRCKSQNPEAIIVVCGCFAQISAERIAEIDGVDIILGTANRKEIVKYLKLYAETKKQIVAPADLKAETKLQNEEIFSFEEKTRAILKIEDGCQNYCTYCAIPFARGKIRSKLPEDIFAEFEHLLKQGYKEVVLTGIHLASYGKDLENGDLADIIVAASRFPFERVRLGSLEPGIVTEDFLQKIKSAQNLMPSFHLSLQSGCDTVLKRMNRHYTTAEYMAAVQLLRKYYPNCAITTDIIVGFPGETEDEFEQTLAFAEAVRFAKIHIFPYSIRTGTKAAAMPNQIPGNIKNERSKRLEVVEQQTRIAFMKEQIGHTVPVLFEQKKGDLWEGYTENYLPVYANSNEQLDNTIRNVAITDTDGTSLSGNIL